MIEVELDKYIVRMRTRLFKWGKLDCVLFASDWAEIKCGKCPASTDRGQYTDEKGGMSRLKKKYGTLKGIFDKDFERVDTAYRQKGDIALCYVDGKATIGICAGRGFVFFKSMDKGVTAKRDPKILTVWRVE